MVSMSFSNWTIPNDDQPFTELIQHILTWLRYIKSSLCGGVEFYAKLNLSQSKKCGQFLGFRYHVGPMTIILYKKVLLNFKADRHNASNYET